MLFNYGNESVKMQSAEKSRTTFRPENVLDPRITIKCNKKPMILMIKFFFSVFTMNIFTNCKQIIFQT